MLISCCMVAVPGWAGDVPLVFGLGGGLDIGAWSGDGVFDFGSVLGGYAEWTGSYPRVYRLSAQWTRYRRQLPPFCPYYPAVHGYVGEPECHEIEMVDFKAFQGGVLWFEKHGGRAVKYAGASVGAFTLRSEDEWKPTLWRVVVSPTAGVRFRLGELPLSVESGIEMVLGRDPTFVVIPLRLYVEI
jgi:hypothetical protein